MGKNFKYSNCIFNYLYLTWNIVEINDHYLCLHSCDFDYG